MSEEKDRMGTNLERMAADMFKRIGFETKPNVFTNKESGERSEQDVLAEKGELRILIQCKDYAKFPDTNFEETIQDLIEDGKSLEASKLILVIIGMKDPDKWEIYAKERRVYLWDENYWRKLQRLDLIELYEEIGKSLEIKEVLKREKEIEERKLNSLYEKIDKIGDAKRKRLVYEQLEKLEFTDYTKREIQIKKIENEILIEKEKEVDEKIRLQVEDIELEELFSQFSSLDFDNKYLILEEIKSRLDLSEKSGRIINVEIIKTIITRVLEDSANTEFGDKRLNEIRDLLDNGSISEDDYEKLKKEIISAGVSKRGIIETAQRQITTSIEIAKKNNRKRKIIKKLKITSIAIVLWAIISYIIWRGLF